MVANTSLAALWTSIGTVGVFGLGVLALVWKIIVLELKKELRPNGGSTFRDAMDARFNLLEDRVEERHRDNQNQFDRINERLSSLEAK